MHLPYKLTQGDGTAVLVGDTKVGGQLVPILLRGCELHFSFAGAIPAKRLEPARWRLSKRLTRRRMVEEGEVNGLIVRPACNLDIL